MEGKGLQVVQPGERTNTEGKPLSSLVLLSIPDSDYSSLRPHLEYVSLPNHLVLHEAGRKVEFAYFPVSYTHLDVYKRQAVKREPVLIGRTRVDVPSGRHGIRCRTGGNLVEVFGNAQAVSCLLYTSRCV